MMLFTLLRPLLPYLLGALLLGGLWVHGYHTGTTHVQRKFDAYIVAQREAVGRITTAWNAERAASELAALRAQEHRETQFAPIIKRSHALPKPIRDVAVAPAVVELLNSAVASVNAAGSSAEPKEAPAAAADLGRLADWAIETVKVCGEYADRVRQWESFYYNLRAVTEKESH